MMSAGQSTSDDSLLDGLGIHRGIVESALRQCREQNLLSRIWAADHTVWKPDPHEIANRLGWLRSASVMMDHVEGLSAFARSVREDGYSHVLLLGMGGSSLAPEVLWKTFGAAPEALTFDLLDTTDPHAVRACTDSLDPLQTLFIVSTKSGGTVETLSLFKHFYNHTLAVLGPERAGRHFIMITDPGSSLIPIGESCGFRAAFLNDPTIGGRYSALSYFGLVPAALMGIDVRLLLARAIAAMREAGHDGVEPGGTNHCLSLGVILGELAMQGRDKMTLVCSPAIASFGDWVEQLIAESTGKEGKGILPVVDEPLGAPEVYGDDRLFVVIALGDEEPGGDALDTLARHGHPIVRLRMNDPSDLGAQFFLWELATAVAGARLGINPFDQPNVESAKVRANEMMAAFKANGRVPRVDPSWQGEGVSVYGQGGAEPFAAIDTLLRSAPMGSYVSVQAYLTPSVNIDRALDTFRIHLRDRYRLPVTVGYGPRFLHSTGQLHKGDGGRGQFVQITGGHDEDVPIPDQPGSEASSVSFGVLKTAQALGDRQALLDAGRRVLRIHFDTGSSERIEELARAF